MVAHIHTENKSEVSFNPNWPKVSCMWNRVMVQVNPIPAPITKDLEDVIVSFWLEKL